VEGNGSGALQPSAWTLAEAGSGVHEESRSEGPERGAQSGTQRGHQEQRLQLIQVPRLTDLGGE